MDPYRFTTIAHHGRALLGPLHESSVDALLTHIDPAPLAGVRTRVLDIGCGKGEILLRALRRYGASGVGVEPNPSFATDARARARGRVPEGDLTLHATPLASAPLPHGGFDVAICTGATHAFGDYVPALEAIARFVRPRGWALIGIGYWRQPPAPEYLATFGGHAGEMMSLDQTLAAPIAAHWRVVAHHESTHDEWDDYESTYAANVHRWLERAPADPDAPAFRERIDSWAQAYATWGRDTMGFTTMVLRR